MGRAGFEPAKVVMTTGLQPVAFDLSATYPLLFTILYFSVIFIYMEKLIEIYRRRAEAVRNGETDLQHFQDEIDALILTPKELEKKRYKRWWKIDDNTIEIDPTTFNNGKIVLPVDIGFKNGDIVEVVATNYDGEEYKLCGKIYLRQFEIVWTTDRGGDGKLEDLKNKSWKGLWDSAFVNGQKVYKRIFIKKVSA